MLALPVLHPARAWAARFVPPAIEAAICRQDIPDSEEALRGRAAWLGRCRPDLPQLPSFPLGDFFSLAGDVPPTQADAACHPAADSRFAGAPAAFCSGEGILDGQRLALPEGQARPAQLAETGRWWLRTAPAQAGQPADAARLLQVVQRPYAGPVVSVALMQGATLEITAGQLLQKANGELVRADALRLGDTLAGLEGADIVERLRESFAHTTVYQLWLQPADVTHNVVYLEGMAVAAARLQQTARPKL